MSIWLVTVTALVSFSCCTGYSDSAYTACYNGGATLREQGNLTSPNYPAIYPSELNCSWTIIAPYGQVIVFNVEMSYLGYYRSTVRSDCNRDRLMVYDGYDTRARNYCLACYQGNITVRSTGNYLHVRFNTETFWYYRDRYIDYGFSGLFHFEDRHNTRSASDPLANENNAWYSYPTQSTTPMMCDDVIGTSITHAACYTGGAILREEGNLTSPHYPAMYPYNINCSWTIIAPHWQVIVFNVEQFFLGYGDSWAPDCKRNRMIVYDGYNMSAWTYCQACIEGNFTLRSTGNSLHVRFSRDISEYYRWRYDSYGFRGLYHFAHAACYTGGAILREEGNLTSPNIPGEFPSVINCAWTIIAPYWKVIVLNVEQLSLGYYHDGTWAPDCNGDRLIVYDGYNMSARTYCQACFGDNFTLRSTGNFLHVRFHLNTSEYYRWHRDKGFRSLYHFEDKYTTRSPSDPLANENNAWSSYPTQITTPLMMCAHVIGNTMSAHDACYGGAVLVEPSGIISGADPLYSEPVTCSWTIRAPDNKVVVLEADGPVDMYRLDTCISVYDGNDTSSSHACRACHDRNFTLTSTGNYLHIVFRSTHYRGAEYRQTQFNMRYHFVDAPGATSMWYDKTFYSKPLWENPFRFPVEIKCSEVNDVVACNGTGAVIRKEGYIVSPNWPGHYPRNMSCSWTIIAPYGQVVVWNVRRFKLNTHRTLTCSQDRLEVYDGDVSLPSTRTYCHACNYGRFTLRSTGQYMVVLFRSSTDDHPFKDIMGFRAAIHFENKYYTRSPSDTLANENNAWYSYPTQSTTPMMCGDVIRTTVSTSSTTTGRWDTKTDEATMSSWQACHNGSAQLSNASGTISSPNHPYNYGHNANCMWTISAPKEKIIVVDVDRFSLEGCDSNCGCDKLSFYDASNLTCYECGSRGSFTIRTEGNTLTIRFYTDGSGTSSGFMARYHLEDPPQLYAQRVGGRCYRVSYVTALPNPTTDVGNRESTITTSSRYRTTGRTETTTEEAAMTTANIDTYIDIQTVRCDSDYMDVLISVNKAHTINMADITLADSTCRAYQVSRNTLVIRTTLDGCATRRTEDASSITYHNALILRSPELQNATINRQRHLQIPSECVMSRLAGASNSYKLGKSGKMKTIVAHGNYSLGLDFFSDHSYFNPVRQFPYYVNLDEGMFVKVSLLASDNLLKISPRNCWASPDQDSNGVKYPLITQGCPDDSTVQIDLFSSSVDEYKFSLRSFEFITYPEIYIHCEVVVCNVADMSSTCQRGCNKRGKRDSRYTKELLSISKGPFVLDRKGEAPHSSSAASPSISPSVTILALVAFVAMAAMLLGM